MIRTSFRAAVCVPFARTGGAVRSAPTPGCGR